jgi:hypothetical protein
VPDRLLGILRHQGLERAPRALVIEKSRPGVAEESCELGPGVRRAHIDDADRLDARPWWLGHDEVRDLAGLDAAPELLFRRHQNGEIERVHRDGDFDPFAATGNDGEHRAPQMGNPHVVLELCHVLFGRCLFGE